MRCGIVGMGTRCVEADQGITPTIAHAPTRIVHGLRPINAALEKVPMIPIEHLGCQNSQCPQAGVRGGENLYFRGYSGKGRRIRLIYCRACKRSFSEREGTALEQARLPDEKALAILTHLREGCVTRATGRLVGV